MGSRVTCLSTLAIIVSSFLLLFTEDQTADAIDPDAWDLVTITNKDGIIFLKNGKIERHPCTETKLASVRAIAYDSANRTLYMGGKSEGRGVISGCNLKEKNPISRIIPICGNPNETRGPLMREMAFNPVTNTLVWYDTETEILSEMNVVSDGNCSEIEKVLHLPHIHVQRIALDICNRFVYWAYWSEESITPVSKVERVRLDGTDRKEIVSDGGLPEEIALAVDDYAEKLYFGSVIPSSSNFIIEESNLEGTDRKVLVNGTEQRPIRLAVDKTAVYWTEDYSRAIWKVYKNGSGKRVVASSTEYFDQIILTPGIADCERRTEADESYSSPTSMDLEIPASHLPNDASPATLPRVDFMVILLPGTLAIMRFLYRRTRIELS